jgi:hypothetical protein
MTSGTVQLAQIFGKRYRGRLGIGGTGGDARVFVFFFCAGLWVWADVPAEEAAACAEDAALLFL